MLKKLLKIGTRIPGNRFSLLGSQKTTASGRKFTTIDRNLLDTLLKSNGDFGDIISYVKSVNFISYLSGEVKAICTRKPMLRDDEQIRLKEFYSKLKNEGLEGQLKRWMENKLPEVLGSINAGLHFSFMIQDHEKELMRELAQLSQLNTVIKPSGDPFKAGDTISNEVRTTIEIASSRNPNPSQVSMAPPPKILPLWSQTSTKKQYPLQQQQQPGKLMSSKPPPKKTALGQQAYGSVPVTCQDLFEPTGSRLVPSTTYSEPSQSLRLNQGTQTDPLPNATNLNDDSHMPVTVTCLFQPGVVGVSQTLGAQCKVDALGNPPGLRQSNNGVDQSSSYRLDSSSPNPPTIPPLHSCLPSQSPTPRGMPHPPSKTLSENLSQFKTGNTSTKNNGSSWPNIRGANKHIKGGAPDGENCNPNINKPHNQKNGEIGNELGTALGKDVKGLGEALVSVLSALVP